MAKPITISDDEITALIDERVREGWRITMVEVRDPYAEIVMLSPDGVIDKISSGLRVGLHAYTRIDHDIGRREIAK